jgi:hypothetical protein
VAEFFSADWRHERVERELAESKARYERRAAAGRKGGTARKPTPIQVVVSASPAPAASNAQAAPQSPVKEPLLSPAAFELEALYRSAAGLDRDDIAWAGLTHQAQIWITRGYDRNLILATASELAARKPGKPLRYHCKAIEQAHEDRAHAPVTPRLPLVYRSQGGSNAEARRFDPSNWKDRRDRGHAALAKLGASIAADEYGEESDQAPIRVVPAA